MGRSNYSNTESGTKLKLFKGQDLAALVSSMSEEKKYLIRVRILKRRLTRRLPRRPHASQVPNTPHGRPNPGSRT